MSSFKDISVLVAGLGSIGQRHVKNLQKLGVHKVSLLRTGKSTRPTTAFADLPTYYDPVEALAIPPTAVFICTPSALHMPLAQSAAEAGCHLFIEKPLSHTMEGVTMLASTVAKMGVQAMVGFQFRFHPVLQQIKDWLAEGWIGEVVSVQAHWGEYLPHWHPWEDYRQGYSARTDLGGGVALTLCHPFDYLRWLVAEIVDVTGQIAQRGGLDITAEDTAVGLLTFANGALGTLSLNYIEQPTRHHLTLVGQQGSITWANETGAAYLYEGQTCTARATPPEGFTRNTLFLDEVRHFLTCIEQNQTPICTLSDGRRALACALALKSTPIPAVADHVI